LTTERVASGVASSAGHKAHIFRWPQGCDCTLPTTDVS